jgi:hypothetical protein
MKRVCENCGTEFEDTSEQLDIEQEFEDNFPGEDREDGAVLCDDCYEMAMTFFRKSRLLK